MVEEGFVYTRETILIATKYYLSVSVHFLRESFKREKLEKSKEVNLGLSVGIRDIDSR